MVIVSLSRIFMAINTYLCAMCKDDFCSHCDPPIECESCNSLICENCESEFTKSDYSRNIFCKNCYDVKSEKEKELLRKTKFAKKPRGLSSEKIKLKTREDFIETIKTIKRNGEL